MIFSWLQIGGGAVAAFFLSYLLHTVDIDRIEAKQRIELAEQQAALNKQCDDQKKLTNETNDALQKDRDTIAAKLAASKRLQPTRCVVPTTGVANNTSGGGKHAGSYGVTSDALYEYSAECETYRSEVILLNNFGLGERK